MDPDPSSNQPIAVVGAGVVGLSSAIRLRECGYGVTIFAERRTPDTTSDRSAAVFTPFRIKDDERAAAWVRASHAAFCELARTASGDSGVSMGTIRELFYERQDGDPWWAGLVGGVRRIVDVPAGYRDAIEADLPRIDMTRYMPWLERRFTATLGGRIVSETITDLKDLFDRGFALVVHCSGLGARRLAGDEGVFPMRGQTLHVPPVPGWSLAVADEGRGGLVRYVFPFRDHVVVGGTFEADAPNDQLDPAMLDDVLERARTCLRDNGCANWRRLGETRLRALAGMRPCRRGGDGIEAVRLETEGIGPGRCVVHNYGHGRTGVTMSWGCAEEVARRVDELLEGPGA